MNSPKRPSLMVPQGDEAASLTVILETLRGLDRRLESQNAASAEDRKLLHDIHIRVVQIESNQVQRRVEILADKVDRLETDRDQRQGMVMMSEWVSKFGPWLVAIFATIAAVVGWNRATGG